MGTQIQSSGKSTGRRRRGHAMMSEINVTPFVDVMLVLLVIFMITAPLMTAGVQIELPKTAAKAISAPDNAPLEITLDGKGKIFFGDTAVKSGEMQEKLRAIFAEAPDRRVYIRGDQTLDYGQVMQVMAAVNTAGFTKVALITDPAKAQTQ
jgi:biopolymer transport protein TolR